MAASLRPSIINSPVSRSRLKRNKKSFSRWQRIGAITVTGLAVMMNGDDANGRAPSGIPGDHATPT
jgi:hypothetical protein